MCIRDRPKYDTVLEIVYKYDDNIRYLIKNSYDDSYGLMTQFETMKPNKKVGIDVRLKLPLYILDNKKYILGTTDLIDMIEECNIWKV